MLPGTEWTLNKFVWPEGNTSEFTDSFLNLNVKPQTYIQRAAELMNPNFESNEKESRFGLGCLAQSLVFVTKP